MTLQAKDLRIGNWVQLNKDWDGEINRAYQIDSISFGCPTLQTVEFGVGVIGWDDVEPIPLTEEWLVRFGFLKIDEDEWVLRDLNISRNVLRDVFVWHPYIDIKYVHQLQNLYHALTGQEL